MKKTNIYRVKHIVEAGIFQGWAYNNIINQIMQEIATEEEKDLLSLWSEPAGLKARAEVLYSQIKVEYKGGFLGI